MKTSHSTTHFQSGGSTPGQETRRGFTLIELLVVIVIISASLAVIVPAFSVMTKSSRIEAGINTVSASISAARVLSHRFKEDDKGGAWPPYPQWANFSGTAVIFCPGGDIRFVINDQKAYAGTGTPGAVGGANDVNFLENLKGASSDDSISSNGYKDIPGIDYARLPNSSGVVGVRRDAGGNLEFLPPPFAVRFNQHGQLAMDQTVIFYDSNFNGRYDTTSIRTGAYELDKWVPKKSGSLAQMNSGTRRYTLPFESIETVSAIVLYDENKFRTQGGAWPNQAPNPDPVEINPVPYSAGVNGIYEWLKVHGRALYFSPYTGLVIAESTIQ